MVQDIITAYYYYPLEMIALNALGLIALAAAINFITGEKA